MSTPDPDCDRPWAELIDYVLGEEVTRIDELEEHLFGCDRCGRRIDVLEDLRHGVRAAVLGGAVGVNVNRSFLQRVAADDLVLREYRIAEGATVSCTAGPEDLVVVRLEGVSPDRDGLELVVDFEDLELGETLRMPARPVAADREGGEVILVFPGEAVRAFPRSRWTMRLGGGGRGGALSGPFVMDHSP